MRRLIPLIAVLTTGALVAGCGSSGGGSSSSSSTPASTTSAPASSGGTIQVKMQNIAFSPTQVTAKVGQTIKWTNDDTVDHNVVATKGATFKSKNFGSGGTFSAKLDKAGTITYVCTIHPGMQGTITVTP